MNAIKKNIGLILSGVVCLLLSVFLVVEIVVGKGRLDGIEKQVEGEISFFDKVRKSRFRIRPDSGVVVNVVQAQKNAEKAAAEYRLLCKDLGTKYQIAPKLPSTSTEAIRWIRENLQEMAEYAVRNGLAIQDLGREFNLILSQGNLAVNEFRTVFRMLYVYRRIVEILAKSGVRNVNAIAWPLQFAVHEVDRYTITPINISLSGEAAVVQDFLNNMCSDTRMLFFLRTLSLTAPDRFSDAVLRRSRLRQEEAAEDRRGAAPGRRREGADPFAAVGSRPGPEGLAGAEGGGAARDGLGKDGEHPEHWVKLDPKRQDSLAYVPAGVTLKVRFDLLEFKVEEPEGSEKL